ncbi:hypothetical protein BC332_16536 [Capsicum chinense]|nr:hypothetical protein BC332_16536 [Capsicum chinense]
MHYSMVISPMIRSSDRRLGGIFRRVSGEISSERTKQRDFGAVMVELIQCSDSDSDNESDYEEFEDSAHKDDILFDQNVNPYVETFSVNIGGNARINDDSEEFISKELQKKMQNEDVDSDCVVFNDMENLNSESDASNEDFNFPKHNPKTDDANPKLALGQIFQNQKEFKKAVTTHEIKRGRAVEWIKDDSVRARDECKHRPSCKWGVQGVELSETVRKMEESISQVILLLEAAVKRCINYFGGSEVDELIPTCTFSSINAFPTCLATFQICFTTPKDQLKDLITSDSRKRLDLLTANLVCNIKSLQQTPTTEERKNLTVSAIAAILTNLSGKCEKQGCGLAYPTYHMKKMTEISIETENVRCCVLKIHMARVIYVYVLTVDGVPTINFDPDLLRTRYALMLWHHGSRKEEEKAQSDDEAPMRPPRNIGIT